MDSQDRPVNDYIVFKKADWDLAVVKKLGKENADDVVRLSSVDNAVVMMASDVFAQAAFFQYAGNIYTTVEILRGVGGDYFDEITTHLQERADHFSELGTWAGTLDIELPE
jgi:hypothetical protein